MVIVVGVDPGARETGLVVVDGDRLLHSHTVVRQDDADLIDVPEGYLLDLVGNIVEAVRGSRAELVAVEGINKPSGHGRGDARGAKPRFVTPEALIATGIVLGAVVGRSYGVPLVRVRAGGNGRYPMETYPVELRATSGQGKGFDKRRHARSAFDVARSGPGYLAMARAEATARLTPRNATHARRLRAAHARRLRA